MFYILSKILFYLLMPLTWVLASLGASIFSKSEQRKKLFFRIGVGLLLFFTNPFFVNEAFLCWEITPTPMQEVKNYDVGILLTGISNSQKEPQDRLYLNKGADRLLHTLMLYKAGKIKTILISGGHFSASENNEGVELKKLLVLSGVPESKVFLENKSLNTRENALFAAQFLQEKFPKKSYLLITSAFHLRRAAACFERAGVQVATFSTDFYSQNRGIFPANWLIPNEKSLYYWFVLLHEVLGYTTYKILGYA